ncbi:MAG: VWA domain-containing protein [Planctomycetaceae bacterium]|jgi:Ca-activated chloride channel family protein|nr:VWA domain-containing protein [Planctomycetaceae bacterium]
MFRFQSPLYFLLLIPLVWLIIQCEFRRRTAGVLFGSVAVLRTLPITWVQRIARILPYLFYSGIALWIAALARPQFGKEEFRLRTEGIAIAFCVDRSGSMAAVDFTIDGQPANRLEAVKRTFRDFVLGTGRLSGRTDDMIGLLAFGGYVDAYCPLTLDHRTLVEMLDQIQLPVPQGTSPEQRQLLADESATAIGDALAQSVDRLKDAKAKSKVILLLSDGDQTFGTLSPLEGAEIARTFGIKVYTIGIGSNGEAPYIVTDFFGNRRTIRQHVSIDETMLGKIAEMTGGHYFNAKNTATLEKIYAEIDQLEKTVHEGKVYTQYTEYFRVPFLTGFVFILLHTVCVCTRFRRLP